MNFLFPLIPVEAANLASHIAIASHAHGDMTGDGVMHGNGHGDSLEQLAEGIATSTDAWQHDRYTPVGWNP